MEGNTDSNINVRARSKTAPAALCFGPGATTTSRTRERRDLTLPSYLENAKSDHTHPELAQPKVSNEEAPGLTDSSFDRSQLDFPPPQPEPNLSQADHPPDGIDPPQPGVPQPEDHNSPEQLNSGSQDREPAIGQRIYAKIKIPPGAIMPGLDHTETAKDIRDGKLFKRLAYVLEIEGDEFTVAYGATFGESDELPMPKDHPDSDRWYPVIPAKKHGGLDPLPPVESTRHVGPAWIYVGEAIPVHRKKLIRVMPEKLSDESLKLVLKAMTVAYD